VEFQTFEAVKDFGKIKKWRLNEWRAAADTSPRALITRRSVTDRRLLVRNLADERVTRGRAEIVA
jgi:hypothetical protein